MTKPMLKAMLYFISAAAASGALFLLLAWVGGRLADVSATFRVEKGEVWFGPLHRKLRFWFGPHYAREATMHFRFDIEHVPVGARFKIFGLSQLSLGTVLPWRALRVKRYGLKEWPDLAHGYSWRFVGVVRERGGEKVLQIRTYTYDQALGGISSLYDVEEEKRTEDKVLGEVPAGQPFTLSIELRGDAVYYELRQGLPGEASRSGHYVQPSVRPGPLFWRHFAHCDNGPSHPVAPSGIEFTAWK